jgi:hypothetical protein
MFLFLFLFFLLVHNSIKNDLSPAWTTTFMTTYTFGKETKFNVGVFDEVRKTNKSKTMGSALFEIGEVLAARGCIKAKKLKNGGTVFVRVTKAAPIEYGTLNLKLRGIKLKNVDGLFGKSDPFFTINSQANDAAGRVWQPVYRSETVKNNLNPQWNELTISIEKICNGDKNRAVQIEVWDWEKNGKHQAMGKFQTTVNALISSVVMGGTGDAKNVPMTGALNLVHKGKSYGKIVVTMANVTGERLNPAQPRTAPASSLPPFGSALDAPPPSGKHVARSSYSSIPPPMAPPTAVPTYSARTKPKFVDYISGGTEINLVVAFDFTGSNGDPRKPGTLHHIHQGGQLNDYEKALTGVGSIVARYDSDQMFPVLGFGAKYGGVIQHCFQIGKAAELKGVSGMMEGYRGVFKTGLTMSGPTVFAEVVQYAAAQAQSKQEANRAIGKQSYTILLILTDGAVTDIEQTKNAIRYASTAPLSIVIVGVGDADFTRMQFLDDFQRDEGGTTRDIVQFVEFSRHRDNRQALTRETLDEIPDQLVNYFHSNGIMPLPPASGSKLNIFEEDYNEDQDVDLNMDINEAGEIVLKDTAQATWDAQSYGTASAFLPPAMAPQGIQSFSAPPQPYQQASNGKYSTGTAPKKFVKVNGVTKLNPEYKRWTESNKSATGQPYTGASAPTAPPAHFGGPPQGGMPYAPPQGRPYGAPPGGPPPFGGGGFNSGQYALPHQAYPTAPVIVPTMVHLQAPPNSYPGMQLQVQNPSTGQFQVVTIPGGVLPGSTFAIQM